MNLGRWYLVVEYWDCSYAYIRTAEEGRNFAIRFTRSVYLARKYVERWFEEVRMQGTKHMSKCKQNNTTFPYMTTVTIALRPRPSAFIAIKYFIIKLRQLNVFSLLLIMLILLYIESFYSIKYSSYVKILFEVNKGSVLKIMVFMQLWVSFFFFFSENNNSTNIVYNA